MGRNWLQRLLEGYGSYKQFMTGRYAAFDQVNKWLLAFALIAFIVKRWVNGWIVLAVIAVSLGLLIYRFFSKKIYVRIHENQRFQRLFDRKQRQSANDKPHGKTEKQKDATVQYVFFACENCGQTLRAPQGKGKIKVTCPKCQHTFIQEV